MHVINCRYGDLVIEWDANGNLTLTRQSDGTRIYVSVSEWNALLVLCQLKGWPVAPPVMVAEAIGM